ncbi:MAG: hypothetical protein HQK75_08865 [Candidatus Magnetomorum sp.]|nr:hypothetical protein [Candidatus Magnetomorum sp.]
MKHYWIIALGCALIVLTGLLVSIRMRVKKRSDLFLLSAADLKSKHILVVDDNPISRKLLVSYLKTKFSNVDQARTEHQAIEKLKTLSEQKEHLESGLERVMLYQKQLSYLKKNYGNVIENIQVELEQQQYQTAFETVKEIKSIADQMGAQSLYDATRLFETALNERKTGRIDQGFTRFSDAFKGLVL